MRARMAVGCCLLSPLNRILRCRAQLQSECESGYSSVEPQVRKCLPRACGDEPTLLRVAVDLLRLPRACGDEPYRGPVARRGRPVCPAHAGMNRPGVDHGVRDTV